MYKINENDAATGALDILFRAKDNGETYVAKQYYKLPMQVMPSYSQDGDGTAYLYMLNPGPGLLQNDRISINIRLDEDAKALVTTPSTNKIYRMDNGCAVQAVDVRVGKNAVLEFLPEHNVPFAGSAYLQRNNYYVEKNSCLIAWDIMTPGRKLCGESFDFRFYSSETNLFLDNNKILCERMNLDTSCGKERFLEKHLALGIYEGKDISGTILAYSDASKHKLCDLLFASFENYPEMLWGASVINDNLLVIKFLSDSVWYMQGALSSVWDCIRRHIICKPAVKIRKI